MHCFRSTSESLGECLAYAKDYIEAKDAVVKHLIQLPNIETDTYMKALYLGQVPKDEAMNRGSTGFTYATFAKVGLIILGYIGDAISKKNQKN